MSMEKTMEKTREEYAVLQQKLNILRRNRETLTSEELRGRYGNAYKRLKSEITDLLNEMQQRELAKIRVPKSIFDNKIQEINDLYVSFATRIKNIANSQYSVDEMMEVWGEFQALMIEKYNARVTIVCNLSN